jgi:hypothetical protein
VNSLEEALYPGSQIWRARLPTKHHVARSTSLLRWRPNAWIYLFLNSLTTGQNPEFNLYGEPSGSKQSSVPLPHSHFRAEW